jgi:hypothetical protein
MEQIWQRTPGFLLSLNFGPHPSLLIFASRLTSDNFCLPAFFIAIFLLFVSKVEALPILDSTIVAFKPKILTTQRKSYFIFFTLVL